MTNKQKSIKLKLNTLVDIEELQIRLKLAEDDQYKITMLCAFRPDATLRQINNAIPKELK